MARPKGVKETKKRVRKPPQPPLSDVLIPRALAWRQYLGCSSTAGLRKEREDPNFPRPRVTGPQRYAYLLSDITKYIANLPLKEEA